MYLYHDLWVLLVAGQKFSVGFISYCSCLKKLGKAGSDAIKVAAAKTRVVCSVLCSVLQVPGTRYGCGVKVE